MENILTLANGVTVDTVNECTVILSDTVKIILDPQGNLLTLEFKNGKTEVYQTPEIGNKRDVRHQVSELLQELGILPHLAGFHYLRTAILLAYEEPRYLDCLVRGLYPEIAKIHQVKNWNRVERGIRTSIEVVWEKGNRELLNEILNRPRILCQGRPTNSEFLSTIVEMLKQKNS